MLTTELLVSELVGNVVRHADYTDEGGRGLQLVAALSRRWGAGYLPDGKCIWTEQELPDRESGGAGAAAPGRAAISPAAAAGRG